MKKVEAILTPCAVKAVRDLLIAQGHRDISVSQFKCAQNHEVCAHCPFGLDHDGDGSRLKLETIVADRDATAVAHAIFAASRRRDIPDHLDSECPLEGIFSIGISKVSERTGLRARMTAKTSVSIEAI